MASEDRTDLSSDTWAKQRQSRIEEAPHMCRYVRVDFRLD
jgi:hypothetical protein